MCSGVSHRRAVASRHDLAARYAGRRAATRSAARPERRGGVFWGWWIVIGAVVAQFAGMGAGGGIAGVFPRPMTEDLGWTSAEYTLGGSAAFFLGGLAGFVVGQRSSTATGRGR